jgi:hypothetical protein
METPESPRSELVSVTVKLPKEILDFYMALLTFTRSKYPLDEFLGYQIVATLEGDANSSFESLIDPKEIIKKYGITW